MGSTYATAALPLSTILVSSCLVLVTWLPMQAQLKPFQVLTLGSSMTYIPNRFTPDFEKPYWHHEWTWSSNIALEVLPKWHLGFGYLHVWSSSNEFMTIRTQHNIYNLFSQFDVVVQEGWRVFVEGSYSYGDYCTCGMRGAIPYKLPELTYLGLGIGAEFRIKKRLNLDIALNLNSILNDVPNKYNYNYYILGLNYRLGRSL